MSYRNFFQLVVLSVLIACCGSYLPDGVLSRKKMVPILVDIHLAEAINNQKFNISMNRDSLPEELYLSICRKYKVDRSVIEKSLLYYGKHTAEYIVIYDEVLDILSEMEVKAKKDTLSPARATGSNADSARIVNSPADTLKNGLRIQ